MELPLDQSLFCRDDHLLVAVSGGADSLSLLHALTRRRVDAGIRLSAIHVHHGMRGDAAAEDVGFLRRVCSEWDVPLAVEYADVPALAAARGVSVEEAGRHARYAAFRRAAAELQCNRVATAHTADDQAETVLLNLLRGTSLDGLTGIPRRRPLDPEPGAPELIRPLLATWRREIEAYCTHHGLVPREDSTNQDVRYRRSRLRYEVLPLLEGVAPHVRENLVRLSRQVVDELAVLRPEAEALLDRARLSTPGPRYWPACEMGEPALLLARDVLTSAPAASARRALVLALRSVAGWSLTLDAALVERLLALAAGGAEAAVDLPGCGLRVRRRDDYLEVAGKVPSNPRLPNPIEVRCPGVTLAAEFDLRLEAREIDPPTCFRTPPDRALLDEGSLRPPLVLRPPTAGERFRPLGAPGAKGVADLFNERGVPVAARPRWPVLADAAGIAWVVGVAIAERLRVLPSTVRCVEVRAARTGTRLETHDY